jgi:general secretion pathway protein D
MKTNHFKKHFGGVLIFLFCAVFELYAQNRGGGGGGGGRGGGGFGGGGLGGGGFGGGGGGGGGVNRTASTASSGQYNNNGTVGTANIQVDPVTHNLIIVADVETTEQIKRVIASLDAPEPQVLIKAVFLEVEDSKALDLGAQGNYTGANGTFNKVTGFLTNSYVLTSGSSTANTVTPPSYTAVPTPYTQSFNMGNDFGLPQSLAGAAGNGGMYQLIGNNFTATIQAIATAGKAQVLSRPSIIARDGQMAEIVVGQSIYLPSSVTLSSVGGTGSTVPSINGSYQNVGVQLDVTPFIGANNLVQMILQPQITSIDGSTPGQVIEGGSIISSAVYAPNLMKRSANTVVVTPDGQTVVIGGLISNDKQSSESKVPLLGDIPVLGNLFKFKSNSNQKDELLMFITPHIVQMPSQLVALTARETSQAPMVTNTNSYSEQELDRFLERVPVKKN